MRLVPGMLMAAMLLAASPAQIARPAPHVSPFACNRTALDPTARRRHFDELGPMLRTMRRATRELSDGYEFEFAGDGKTYALLNEWAEGERLCCPFFDLSIRAGREDGAIFLQLTGRDGTKQFVRADFPEVWFQK